MKTIVDYTIQGGNLDHVGGVQVEGQSTTTINESI